jgi:hypothetical protein
MLVQLTDLMVGLVWPGVSKAPPDHHSRDSDSDTEKQCPRMRSHGLSTHPITPDSHIDAASTSRIELHSHHHTQPLLSPPLPRA